MIHTVYLPFPSNKLSPNARVHWAKLALAKKTYKQTVGWECIAQGLGKIDADMVHVVMTFFPPSARHFDLDGLISRFKAALDAISEVIGIDDRYFTLAASKASAIRPHGQVRVDIEWTDREARAA